MRFKPTLILLTIAVAAVLYLAFVEQPNRRERASVADKEKRFTGIVGPDVFGIKLHRSGDTLTFVRTGFDWEMTAPVRDRADMASVNVSVLSVTKAEIEKRFEADASQLSDYGLAEPAVTITLYDSTQTKMLAVDVGDMNLTKSHCYARVHGSDEVFIVPAGVRRYSIRSNFDYRDKRIVHFEVSDVSHMSIRSELQESHWTRSENGGWHTTIGNDTIRGDEVAMETVLRELRGLRAVAITDPPFDTSHPQTIAGTITVTKRDSTLTVLRFSEPDSNRSWLTVSGTARIAGIDRSALDVFHRPFDDLRDRRILHFDPDAVGKITLETDATAISILHAGSEWTFANPTLGEIDPIKVAALLQTLESIKYREILNEKTDDPAEAVVSDVAFRLSLFDASHQPIDETVAGPIRPLGRTHLATSRSTRLLGVVDSEILDEIQQAFEQFRLE